METKVSFSALNEIMPFTPETFERSYNAAGPGTKAEIDSAVELFARCIVNAGTLLAPSRIVLVGKLFRAPALRDRLINACSELDGAYSNRRIFYTALYGRESYIGPAAVFAQKKLG